MKQLRYNFSSLLLGSLLLISLLTIKQRPFRTEKFDSPVTSLTDKSATLADGREITLESKYGKYTIILVRHAEKMDESNDPELSTKGVERATRLAEILKMYKADKVYATDYKRTKGTVNAYMMNSKSGLQTYDVAKQTELKGRIIKNGVRRSIIVGHSNSIPQLINTISGLSLKEFGSNDYGNLILIKTDLKKKGKVYFFNY